MPGRTAIQELHRQTSSPGKLLDVVIHEIDTSPPAGHHRPAPRTTTATPHAYATVAPPHDPPTLTAPPSHHLSIAPPTATLPHPRPTAPYLPLPSTPQHRTRNPKRRRPPPGRADYDSEAPQRKQLRRQTMIRERHGTKPTTRERPGRKDPARSSLGRPPPGRGSEGLPHGHRRPRPSPNAPVS